jgi:hypothetical protein
VDFNQLTTLVSSELAAKAIRVSTPYLQIDYLYMID